MKIAHSAKPKIDYNQLNNRARVFALFKLRISLRINFLKILLLNFVIIVTIVAGQKIVPKKTLFCHLIQMTTLDGFFNSDQEFFYRDHLRSSSVVENKRFIEHTQVSSWVTRIIFE